ncbi:metalloregulator ArsR/SmtB family transcription factor [archaeon]|nr:metalloregulator ArsR/SmtB family transcription factor [archaeon]
MIDSTYMSFLRGLCNDTRLNIIICLKKSSKNVSEIVKELDMEQSRISHNLQCLERNGFVTVMQDGKQRIYSLNKETIQPILDAIDKHVKKHKICTC